MPLRFDHERLKVYQRSLDFVEFAGDLLENLPRQISARDQLDRASTSIPHNIAEGNGKFTPKDRCRFLDIAHGSALECAASLDVLVRRNALLPASADEGKDILADIVSMLFGLIRSICPDRTAEDPALYGSKIVEPDSYSLGEEGGRG